MALILKDRVQETSTTTGTGTFTLNGAVEGFSSFSVIGDGNTTYYSITSQGTQFEIGIGTYTSSGTTLSRDTVLASSNSNNLVNFSAGTKNVFVTYPAGKSVNLDASGNLDLTNVSITSSSNGNITLIPNGTGDVVLSADTVQIGDSNTNATFTTNGTGDLILNTNAGTNSGSITIQDAANGNIILAPNGTGRVEVSGTSSNAGGINFYEDTDNGTNKALLTAPASLATDITLTLPPTTSTLGYLSLPAVGTKTGSYTLDTGDVGKYVQVGSGGAITIPDATFTEGDAVSIFNNTTTNMTITCTITTAYIAGTDSDKATMTLSTRGIATILFINSTTCVVTGNVT
jgi:hypothetical protein